MRHTPHRGRGSLPILTHQHQHRERPYRKSFTFLPCLALSFAGFFLCLYLVTLKMIFLKIEYTITTSLGLYNDKGNLITEKKGQMFPGLNGERAQIFKWKCWDECSCLPPIIQDHKITMHQSYKTSDHERWHSGWEYQRQTWIDLHPEWFFIFWTDEQNELLAKCIGYNDILRGRTGIQKADLSRFMYLYKYGGFYSDMDYIAIQNHQQLFDADNHQLKNQVIMLQGRQEQIVGLEWGFARHPQHPLWTFCLDIANRQKNDARTGCPIFYTGPKLLGRCLKKYFKLRGIGLEHMVSYGNEVIILEPKLIAPIGAYDFTSECGKWRNISDVETENIVWKKM